MSNVIGSDVARFVNLSSLVPSSFVGSQVASFPSRFRLYRYFKVATQLPT